MRATSPYLAVVVAAAGIFVGGCERRDDLDGRRRPIPGLEPTAAAAGETGRRRELAFDAFDNRATAEVFAAGSLVVDGRGPSLATFTRGGAAGGWIPGSGSTPAARVDGQVAQFWFWRDRDPGGIAADGDRIPLRLKFRPAAAGQLVSVFLNGEKVDDVPMEASGTSTYEASLPAAKVVDGPNVLRLFFRYAISENGTRTAGSLDRIAIGAGPLPSRPPLLAAPVERGGKRRDALSMRGPGRLSFSVQVPRARPLLELGVSGKGRVEVRAAVASGESKRLWTAQAGEGWTDAEIDLSEIAGELIRLDLIGEGPVDWSRPRVVADPADTASPSPRSADHVILVVAAGLRADAIDQMPATRALAEAGIARTALSRRPSAEAAREIWTGAPGGGPIAAGAETLAEKFSRAGYATALVTSGPALAGDSQGFDEVSRAAGARATVVWAAARERLAKVAERRSFTAVWLDDATLPWNPDPARIDKAFAGYTGRVQPSGTRWLAQSLRGGAAPLAPHDRDMIRALYAGELAEIDAAIAAMMADLEELGIAGRTAVIITGDRGQELFERGGFGDPDGLWRHGVEVPLIVRPAGAGLERTDPGEPLLLADVHATALELAQIPTAPGAGRSALSPAIRRVAVLELPGAGRGLQWGRYKWVAPSGGEARLYDLAADAAESAGDPERHPVAARALSRWYGLLEAFGPRWSARRWGSVTAVRPAFAAEVGGL